jgi:RNA polymerase sigma-70 factor (ECF subfamily)
MAAQNPSRWLSCIETSWSTVYRAHQGEGDELASAQRQLLQRYYHPIYRYLRGMTRDGDAAEELTHEFVVRFLRGDFKWADRARGRFRDLLKRALRLLAIDHWRRKRVERERSPLPVPRDWPAPPGEADWRRCPPPRRRGGPALADWRRAPPPPRGPADDASAERAFLRGWTAEMLARAWEGLARLEEESGCPYHTALRLRTEQPDRRCADLARLAAARLGKPLSEAAFRQLLRRAREKFADRLVAEVARTLDAPDPDAVEDELIELDLHPYCRRAVARLRRSRFLGSAGEPESVSPPSAARLARGSNRGGRR